jgi:hypothetical protein
MITLTRSGNPAVFVTVDYATTNGTATAGQDYIANSGTLTLAPGEITKTFNVTVNDDTLDEPDETINLTLSSPTGATLGLPFSAVLTILDDEISGAGPYRVEGGFWPW